MVVEYQLKRLCQWVLLSVPSPDLSFSFVWFENGVSNFACQMCGKESFKPTDGYEKQMHRFQTNWLPSSLQCTQYSTRVLCFREK